MPSTTQGITCPLKFLTSLLVGISSINQRQFSRKIKTEEKLPWKNSYRWDYLHSSQLNNLIVHEL